MSSKFIELNHSSLSQPLLNKESRTQEFNNFNVTNYEVPTNPKLIKPLLHIHHKNIQKFLMFSSEKAILIYKNEIEDSENQMKLYKKNDQICSNILSLPNELESITNINFLKFRNRLQKKKIVFLAGGNFLGLVEVKEGLNYELSLHTIEIYKKHESFITTLASCSVDNNEGYILVSGDENGTIRRWKFDLNNNLLEEEEFANMNTKIMITSLTFNNKNDKLAAGNSISEYKIWTFPMGSEIKSSKSESSQENTFLQFGERYKDRLIAAYEAGSVTEVDLKKQDIEFLSKEKIIQNKSKNNRVDSFSVNNIFYSSRKNFLIVWSSEKMENSKSCNHFLFFSEARKHIEENLMVEDEKIIGVSIIHNVFAYATSNYVKTFQLKEDFELSIEPPKMLHIKACVLLKDNTFWVAGSEQLIYYSVNSTRKNKTKFYPLEEEEEEEKERQVHKPLSCLAYCVSKSLIASSTSNIVKIWSVSYKEKKKLEYEFIKKIDIPVIKIKKMEFDKQGEILIFSEADKISYFNFETLLVVPYTGESQSNISDIAYSDSKNIIISAGIVNELKTVTLWFHKEITVHYKYLQAHNGKIKSLALIPEENNLVSAGFDGRIIFWNLDELKNNNYIDYFEKEIRIPGKKIHAIAISSNRKKIATVCADARNTFSIMLWNNDTGQKEKSWNLKEDVKKIVFSRQDKYLLITYKNSLHFKKIKDYFYKSSFFTLHKILQEKLEMEEYIEKYPTIFNESFMKDVFFHYENKIHNQTILHIYAYLFKAGKENYYDQCLKICEYFGITPKFSIDVNNYSPLDLISREKLYYSIKLIMKTKFPLNFCPAINVLITKRVAKFDPLLLMAILENRLCDPYGVLDEKLPSFEGPIQTTLDRVVLSNDYIIKNILPKESISFFNKSEGNKTFKKNFEIKILDIPFIFNPENFFIKSKKKLIESSHPLYGNKEFEAILELKWNVYARKKFFKRGIIFLLYVIILSINSIFILIKRLYPDEEEIKYRNTLGLYEKFHVLSILFDFVLIFFLIYFLFSELAELYKRKKQYWKDLWNYFDLLNMGFLSVSLALDLNNIFGCSDQIHILKAFFAITLFLAWLRLVTYSRGFRGLGFMVRLLLQVFIDMKNFLILMFFITLSITVAGFLLQDYNKFSIFETFNSFYRLILGDFGGFDDLSDNGIDWLLWVFFFIGTLSLMIIMLNLLIAIISDTYQAVTVNNILANNYEKSQIVAEMDEILSSKEKINLMTNSLKKYLCVLYSKEISILEEEENQDKKDLRLKFSKIEEKLEELKMLLIKNNDKN